MDAFYGEIRIFGFTFPPQNWAMCNGQTLSIMQYQVLYTILGTQFGGDGNTTFKLPNLQGSAVCNQGQGTGLTLRSFHTSFGSPTATLQQSQIPSHQHAFNCYVPTNSATITNTPTSTSHFSRTLNQFDFTNTDTFDTGLAIQMVGATGGGAAHENRQPFLAMTFCICMYGEYPLKA